MSVSAVIALVVAVVALALLVWILRQPKVFEDGHPRCRRCGFDLFGMPAESTRCSECGNDVSSGRGVIHAPSHRRQALGVFAVLVVALIYVENDYFDPLLYYKSRFLQRISAFSAHHEPIGGLLERASAARNFNDAFSEISRRIHSSELTEVQMQQVIAHAMKMRSNPNWYSLIETARQLRKVSDADWRRCAAEAFTANLQARSDICRGDPLPFVLSVISRPSLRYTVIPTVHATADGPVISLPDVRGLDESSPYVLLSIPATALRNLSDGNHQLAIDLDVALYDTTAVASGPFLTMKKRITAPWAIYPATRPAVEIVSDPAVPVPMLTAKLVDSSPHDPDTIDFSMRADSVAIDGFYRVYVRSGEREKFAGEWCWSTSGIPGMWCTNRMLVHFPGADRSRLQIIMRPDPVAAARTIDIYKIDGRELTAPIELPTDSSTSATQPTR